MAQLVKRVDVTKLVPQAAIVLFGARRRGKTTAAKYMVYKMYQAGICDNFYVVCGNRNTAISWREVVHEIYIRTLEDPLSGRTMKSTLSELRGMLMKQGELIEKDHVEFNEYCKRMQRADPSFEPPEYAIPKQLTVTVILDDCGGKSSFVNSPEIELIANEGRHFGITILILCQHFMQVNRTIRDNADYVGIFNTNDADTLDTIRKKYLSTLIQPSEWRQLISKYTAETGHMCWVDVSSTSQNRSDRIFINVTDKREHIGLILTDETREFLKNPRMPDDETRVKIEPAPMVPSQIYEDEEEYEEYD